MWTPFTQLKLGVNEMGTSRYCGNGALASIGFLVHFLVKGVRTLLIALLFAFPILGDAADDWPASNWVWKLPGERQIASQEVRKVVDFKSLLPGPYGDAFSYPSGRIIEPPRNSQSIEAAEILNSLRMDRYRRDCEMLKHTEMHGTPALYPTQIPWLGSP